MAAEAGPSDNSQPRRGHDRAFKPFDRGLRFVPTDTA
jgi:hypothetical protein